MEKRTIFLLSKDPQNSLSIDTFDDTSLLILVSIFEPEVDNENKTITVDSIYEVSAQIKENVGKFVDHFKDQFPHSRKLSNFFENVKVGEHIALVFDADHNNIKSMVSIHSYLQSLDDPEYDFESNMGLFESLYGYALKNYSVFTSASDRKTWFGEPDKNKRVCRFCNKSKADGASFSNIAHAIPESLGNKKSLLNEECDSCNSYFSGTIETSITDFLKVHTVFFGIKNKKKKVPKFKGSNFEYTKKDDGRVSIKYIEESDADRDDFPLNVPLKTKSLICMQDIYKALCKFALGVIETELCPSFSSTFR